MCALGVSAKSLQSRPTLCHPMGCSPPGSSVHGILQSGLPCPPPGDLPNPGIEPASLMSPALAGVFFTTSVTWEAPVRCVYVCLVSQSCPTHCDPIDSSPAGSSVHGTSQVRLLKWVAFPTPGDLPNSGIKPASPVSPALAYRFFTTEPRFLIPSGLSCPRLQEQGWVTWDEL